MKGLLSLRRRGKLWMQSFVSDGSLPFFQSSLKILAPSW